MGFWSKPEPPVLHLNVNSACPFLFTEENDLTDVCFPRFGNEAVEERVHERVEDGDSDADLVQIKQPCCVPAVVHLCLEEHDDVCWSKADQQAEQDHCQQLEDLLAFLFLCGLVGSHRLVDPPGGEHHQDNGDDQAQQEARQADPSQVIRHGEDNVEAERAAAVFLVGVVPGDGGGVETDHRHPNGSADGCCRGDFPADHVLERMNHSQVAVEGDAAEQSLAGVKVGEEDVDGEEADEASMHPHAAPQVVQPHQEADGEAQVAERQVEQVHAELVLLPNVLPGHVEGEGVGRDGDGDDEYVEEHKHPLPGCVVVHVALEKAFFQGQVFHWRGDDVPVPF